MNGFELADALVPAEHIQPGGPPRDGIPAIDAPRFVAASASGLQDEDRVLGVRIDGRARAYPVRILNWHEVVNDSFNGTPVAVTYCPLCGSGVVYFARVDGKDLRFGVSGLLYNSDVLLYDRGTESLWSQIMSQAISGPMKGTRLERIPVTHTTWSDWRSRYPHTLVLTEQTGFQRDYGRDPYANYHARDRLLFQTAAKDGRLPNKTLVLGVEINGHFKAYPLQALAETAGALHDRVAGEPVIVHYDQSHRTAEVTDADGRTVATILLYWFAWKAFHPDTAVYGFDPS